MLNQRSFSCRILPRALLALAVPATIVSASGNAAADPTIAADLDYAIPIDQRHVSSGGGFGFRVGNQLHAPGIVITPELGFTYASFGDDYSPKTYRGIAGLRL